MSPYNNDKRIMILFKIVFNNDISNIRINIE